ncbi:hypothetical protein BD414DRAFT_201424 [Trametes punicea]|nr:hypothetical protein BD414DRAFT_201424 [Trametes punicea]
MCWISLHPSSRYNHLLCTVLLSLGSASMSSCSPAPSLCGVLLVLNAILALIWVPILDTVDDASHVFHAVLFVNAFTAGWWISMNTSLRRRVRLLSRHAIISAQFLASLLTTILDAPLRLLSLFPAYPRQTGRETSKPLERNGSFVLNGRQIHALRLAWLITSCYEESRDDGPTFGAAVASTMRLHDDASKRRQIVKVFAVMAGAVRGRYHAASRRRSCGCSRHETLVHKASFNTSSNVDVCDGVHTTMSSAPSKEFLVHPTLEPVRTLTLRSRQSSAHSLSTHSSITNLSARYNLTMPDSLAPSTSLPDADLSEIVQLNRDLETSIMERDMYRARAYELAMRLDDCYSAHAQTTCALERTECELSDARRAIHDLEAERRGLTVALALLLTSARTGSSCSKATPSSCPVDNFVAKTPAAGEKCVVHPRTPSRGSVDKDERPLLLPQTVEIMDDTPARSRITTWTATSVEQEAQSALERVICEARQRAKQARSKSRGLVAIGDMQHDESSQPVFSAVHHKLGRDRGPTEVSASKEPAAQAETGQIVADLRTSRPRTTPPEIAVLESRDEGVDHQVYANTSTEHECEEDKDESHQPPIATQVQITRQPRGPPPSPYVTAADRTTNSAVSKGKEHTWRGRSSQHGAGLHLRSVDVETVQSYPDSRMPNRARPRQATAPSPAMVGESPIGPLSAKAVPVPSQAVGPGEHHRRHATFNGGFSGASAPGMVLQAMPSVRWPTSAAGNGAFERLRAPPMQPYPFVPSSAFYQPGRWTTSR